MERKAVKFITVFILSLMLVVTCPLLGFQSEAAELTLLGKFEGSFSVERLIYYSASSFGNGNYNGSYDEWVKSDNITLTTGDLSVPRGHKIIVAVSITGTPSVTKTCGLASCHGTIYHISKSGIEHSEIVHADANTTSFYIDHWDDRYFNVQIESFISSTFSHNVFATNSLIFRGTFDYVITVYDAGVMPLETADSQAHSDAQDQLKESQKQTDAMTKFDGKSDMDKNSSDLNGSLSGYDEAQQSIFSSSTASIEKFDVDNLFNFTVNISSALLVWNNLMVSIVASMGDFSLIYTISMGLVFIGIVVGIWRFFVK